MKVSRIHSSINNQYKKQNSAFTQNLTANTFKTNFNNNNYNNKLTQNDVFVRLAAASTRDARIEKELTDMGLI